MFQNQCLKRPLKKKHPSLFSLCKKSCKITDDRPQKNATKLYTDPVTSINNSTVPSLYSSCPELRCKICKQNLHLRAYDILFAQHDDENWNQFDLWWKLLLGLRSYGKIRILTVKRAIMIIWISCTVVLGEVWKLSTRFLFPSTVPLGWCPGDHSRNINIDFRWLFQVSALQSPKRPLPMPWKASQKLHRKPMENLNSFSCLNYDTISSSLTLPIIREFQRIVFWIRFHRRVTHAAQVIWCQSRIVLTKKTLGMLEQADMASWPIDRFQTLQSWLHLSTQKIAYIAYLKKWGGGLSQEKIYTTPTPGFTFHWNAKHSPSCPLQRLFVGQRSRQPTSPDWCGSWSLVHNLSQFKALERKQRPWVKLRLGSSCIIPPCGGET